MSSGPAALNRELRAHLRRLAAWSILGGIAGLVIIGVRADPAGHAFGGWTAGWCAVNLLIVLASWRGRPPQDRRRFREFLMLNEGLNLGYVGVGVALALAAVGPDVRAAGTAIAVQGFALFVLDTWLLRRVPIDG